MKCVKTKHLGQIAEKRERGGESGSMCMVLKRAIKVDIKNFSLSQGIFLIQCGFFKAVFNSRTAIAGAIFGLLLVFLFRRRDFCYDHMRSQPLQICFLFIRSYNFN